MEVFMSNQKLNPQIRTVNIGVKELRPITIYPLSMGDQTKMVSLLKNILTKIMERNDDPDSNDIVIADLVIQELEENLPILLKYVTDEEINLDNLTNYQFTEIVGHVYKDNFEDASKNVKSLVEKTKKMFNFTRS